jgi:hypothetical protein
MITTKPTPVHPAVDACNDLQRAIRRELAEHDDPFYACNSARVQIALERLVMEIQRNVNKNKPDYASRPRPE